MFLILMFMIGINWRLRVVSWKRTIILKWVICNFFSKKNIHLDHPDSDKNTLSFTCAGFLLTKFTLVFDVKE